MAKAMYENMLQCALLSWKMRAKIAKLDIDGELEFFRKQHDIAKQKNSDYEWEV